jgi:cation:H+ antiporter
MTTILTQLTLSTALIVIAGLSLAKSAERIAELTGWGRMFVGALFLAGATSLPELIVDLRSIRVGLPDLATGDLLGSCLFNLLILALLDFGYPSKFRRTSFSPKFLHHSLAAVLTMVLTSLVGIAIASGSALSVFGVSVFLWGVMFFYLYGVRLILMDGRAENTMTGPGEAKSDSSLPKSFELFRAFAGYALSSCIILGTAPSLVDAADQVAIRMNLGHSFVGTTLVALTTSLPELIATLAAFRIGSPDLAIGNIFGSNAFNIMLFVPLDFMAPGVLFASVQPTHAVTAFSVVIVTGIAVMGQIYRKKERSRFSEPSSETVVVMIFLFLLFLYFVKDQRR